MAVMPPGPASCMEMFGLALAGDGAAWVAEAGL